VEIEPFVFTDSNDTAQLGGQFLMGDEDPPEALIIHGSDLEFAVPSVQNAMRPGEALKGVPAGPGQEAREDAEGRQAGEDYNQGGKNQDPNSNTSVRCSPWSAPGRPQYPQHHSP
jgi:hypothetical protein